MSEEAIIEESVKFCPTCGHEGNDVVCPICDEKMASLDDEVKRVADLEKAKDVTEPPEELSLEDVAKEEEKGEE